MKKDDDMIQYEIFREKQKLKQKQKGYDKINEPNYQKEMELPQTKGDENIKQEQ